MTIYKHKWTGELYKLLDGDAKVKISGSWYDAVVYSPLYDNETKTFCRLKVDFLSSFGETTRENRIHYKTP